MAPTRLPAARPAARAAAPPPQVMEGINFGSLGMYVAGGGLPEGNYAIDFTVQMFQAQNQLGQSRGPARLGVMVTAYDLERPQEEPKTQFYSMGSNADKSFAPNPDTGKGLVAIPGAAGTTMNDQTNWAYFLKSLYDCSMPEGVFTNDFTTIDGIWVHISHIPEPEQRKGFATSTGEVGNEPRKAGTIGVVSEILEDGKPWEGTGGFDFLTAPAPAKASAKAPVAPRRPAAAPTRAAAPAAVATPARPGPRRPAAPPPPAVEEEVAASDEDVMTAAINAVSDILVANPTGLKRLKLRTGVFAGLKASAGDQMAQDVTNTYFADDESLNTVLAPLGYKISGDAVVVA